MSRQVFDYANPDRFVTGTVGMPGERTFFLQARKGSAVTSVALEKAQVAALAEQLVARQEERAVLERRPFGVTVRSMGPKPSCW